MSSKIIPYCTPIIFLFRCYKMIHLINSLTFLTSPPSPAVKSYFEVFKKNVVFLCSQLVNSIITFCMCKVKEFKSV